MNEIKRQLKMKMGDTTHQQRNVVNKIQQQSIASAQKNKPFVPVLLSIVLLATTLFFVFSMAKENETEIHTHTAANEQIVEMVTVIEVLQWETNELITDINDTEFIEKLIEELNSAKTVSTETAKLRSPDYKLLIIRNGEAVYQLGYYKDVMKLDGLESRYLDLKEEKMYGVTLELPSVSDELYLDKEIQAIEGVNSEEVIKKIEELSTVWATALKTRVGKPRYEMMSEKAKEKFIQEQIIASGENWNYVIGDSSPWIVNFEIQIEGMTATITYAMQTSEASNYSKIETIHFIEDEHGKIVVDDYKSTEPFSKFQE